jgi:hypothetical protein
MHRFISRIAKTLDVQHSCFGDAGSPAGTQRPSRTERHRCARVESQHVHLRNGGPK